MKVQIPVYNIYHLTLAACNLHVLFSCHAFWSNYFFACRLREKVKTSASYASYPFPFRTHLLEVGRSTPSQFVGWDKLEMGETANDVSREYNCLSIHRLD